MYVCMGNEIHECGACIEGRGQASLYAHYKRCVMFDSALCSVIH